MAGTATLRDNLVDGLVPVVDQLRQLAADLGARQYRTYLVKRRWSGAQVGEGTVSVVSTTELVPPPQVTLADTHALTTGGLQEVGTAELAGVSLSYGEADLSPTLARNEELFYRLDDALGQGIHTRWYKLQDHPRSHRGAGGVGWTIPLRRLDATPTRMAP